MSLSLALAPVAAWAQQFDRNLYNQMVDASSPDTIPPGTKITLQNWTQYKRFMPAFMQFAFAGKMHFHVADTPEYVMNVVATEHYPVPKAMREDTEKYAGQTKLVPDPRTGGYTWAGYRAGTPFPDPQEPLKAVKVMYNAWSGFYAPFLMHEFSHNWETDSFGNVMPEDTDDSFYRLMHLSDPPYPENLPDAGGNIFAYRFVELIPEQAKYTTSLELVPNDPSRLTDEYVFLPSLRRSLRLSSASRCAPILGTDYLADDSDWKPAYFIPEYYGEKKILVAYADQQTAMTENSRFNYVGGDFKPGVAFPGWPKPEHNSWQLRKVHIINLKPVPSLGRGYCYGQRVLYTDAENWNSPYFENYDRNGNIYHLVWYIVGPMIYQGVRTVIPRTIAFSAGIDFQNNHASPDILYDMKMDKDAPGEYLEPGVYTPSGLEHVMK